ncbi:hypothetical protein LXN10_03695 [Arcobacter sp. KX21116]|uniref:hypothetical protein n=1 Tax=Arcobacter iocasae TaxID=2906515 RepID=UPI0035D51AAD
MKKNKIIFFVKTFEKKEYMLDFLNGKLYLNKLSYFKKIEEELENNRADEKEGLCAVFQAKNTKFEINGYQLKDIVGPIEMKDPLIDNIHILCLFAGSTNEDNIIEGNKFKRNKLDEIAKDLNISDNFKNLGKYCVLIHNTSKFIDRVVKTVKKLNYYAKAGLVKYYDYNSFNGSFQNLDAAFNKRNQYNHQKEYRFAIDTNNTVKEALVLDIGNIEDIATQIDLTDLKIKFI